MKRDSQKKSVFVEKSQHLKNNATKEEFTAADLSDDSIKEKIFDCFGWIGFGVFLFWALGLLILENPVAAIITAALGIFISPLRKRVLGKLNMVLTGKRVVLIASFLFLSSCTTSIGLTEVEEVQSADSQTTIVETVEESLVEETFSAENEIEQLTVAETIEEILTEVPLIDNPENNSVEEGMSESTSLLAEEEKNSEMQVHFIDVGQGDATLITCDDEAMLIDAGDNSKGTTVQLYLKKQGITKLKYLVLTHPDADHIGGADVIVNKFDIETVFMSDYKKDNKTYDELISALSYKNLKWSTPNVGNSYSLGSAEFIIIAPNTSYSDPNNSSIGLVLKNGEDAFLFTGDAEEEAECDILANGLDIDCDVYKAGHHGSKTASTKELLQAASPVYVVVSCAEDNSYGHPHAEPMNNFRSMKMKLFRTDEQGSVIATSNGTGITWNCVPSESWQAGENTQSSNSKTSSVKTEQSEGNQSESVIQPEPAPQPEPQPEPEPVPSVDEGILVWQSATGEKYHSINDCGRMNPDKARQITLAQAKSLGLEQCSKCW